jgi:dUTP pyrophosphatase
MKIKITDKRITPEMLKPATNGSGAIDLRASIEDSVLMRTNMVYTIPTGIKVAIPEGYIGIIAPRSGVGSDGVRMANTVGYIDSDYRGEIFLKLIYGPATQHGCYFKVDPLDRLCQMTVVPHFNYANIEFTNSLDMTDRGEGGYGHTGKQ